VEALETQNIHRDVGSEAGIRVRKISQIPLWSGIPEEALVTPPPSMKSDPPERREAASDFHLRSSAPKELPLERSDHAEPILDYGLICQRRSV
jgi:hypothetical protein